MSISLRRMNSLAVGVRLVRLFFVLSLLLLAGAFVQAQAAGITLVQHIGKDAGTTTTSTLAFVSANTAGNFIAVGIRGGLSSSQVFTVTDSNGNSYKQAAQIGYTASQVTSAVYYAESVKGGANTITVSMTVSGPLRFDILEYSGVATLNSLDATATATGSSATPSSSNLTTTVSGDLLFAVIGTTNPATFTAGTGYTIRDFVPVEPNTKHIGEDQIQAAAGSVSAGATLAASDSWGVVLTAFKPAGGVAGVPATIAASAGTTQSATVNTAFATQLQATVKDSFNNPVSGATVTFTAPGSGASGTFAGGVTMATTNASGVATAAVFTANTTAGAYIVTASVSGVSTPANFSLTNLAGGAASIAATSGTPQSAAVNTAFATQLQATVKDSFGNPVSNATVTFTAPASQPTGTFAGGVNTATTNASGTATAPVFTAGTATGTYTVTASVSGVAGAANYSLTNLAGAANSITATAGTPQSATVNTAYATQLQATVKDSFGNLVSGVTVTFTAPGSGASGTFAGGVKTATTNASGVATAAVFTANTTAGAYTVTASVSGVSTPANFSLTNLAASAASITATAGTPQSASINTAFATQLQATVKDSFGNGVSSVTVTFAAPGSGASGTFAGGLNTATTNTSGVATSAVFTANGTAGGPYTVTASATGVGTSASFSLTNLGNPPANVVASAGTPQSATINTAFAAQLQVTVTDSGNNPVSGVTVTFTAPGSGAGGTFAGGVNTATTNASGVATSGVFTANSVAGSYTVSATVSGVASPANFSLTNLAGAAASITATAGTPQSATVGTAYTTQFQATVKDAGGNPVNGLTVTFAAPGSGASGTFAGGVTTATTNASGIATAAVFTANNTAGTYTVMASVAGVASPANFSLTNLAGAAASIAASSGTPQSATVNTAFATQLQATVLDSFNNPVSGVTVTFTAPTSGASGTFAGGVNTATTSASGVATAPVFTANSVAGGPYAVTASVSGVGTSANFSLTNTASVAAPIALVQHISKDAGSTTTSTLAFASANTAGNFIAVAIRGGLSSAQVFTVNDSNANTYRQAAQIGYTASLVTSAVYYAENIKAGANTITVTMSVSGPLRFDILEYSNVANSSSLDVTSVATGSSATPSTPSVNTTVGGDLLLATIGSTNAATFTAGTGFTIRDFVPIEPNTKHIAEDQIQSAAGTVSAGATLAASDSWGVVLAAFKPATGGGGGGIPASITATAGTPQSAIVNNAFAIQLQATVKDSLNNPVSGVTVTFAAPASGASGTFAGGVVTATTNASGVATAAGFTANTISGSYVVTASVSGVATPASFSLTNLAGSASSITATAGTPQSAAVNTAFATQLQATVKDSFSNPVNGVTVTFAAPPSGASGTFAGGVNTATTNASGVATAPVLTANATTGSYTVTASVSGVAIPANFSLTNTAGAPPSISSLSLTQGPVGATFTVNGANFGSSPGTVTLNNTPMAASNWTATAFNVTVPSGASSGNVVVTVGGLSSNGMPFTVTPPPNITNVNPTFAPVGGSITVTGTNFGPTVGTIQSFVTFNGTQSRTTFWSNTSISVPVPVGATNGNVVVSVGGVASNGVPFTVTSPPSITSLSPTSGPVGTSVTISGSGFGPSQGTTSSVTFNGTMATPTNWSDTSILVPVPSGATPGNVIVSIAGVASNGMNFNVTSSTGNIALVQHTSKDAGSTTTSSLAFASANAAGNWIAVLVRAGGSSSQVFTITDSNANMYHQAFQLGLNQSAVTLAIYYAENIKGGANTITLSDTVAGPLRFAALEYSGVATSNSLELSTTAQGSSTAPNSGSATTTSSGDLLLAAVVTTNAATFTAGSGYTIEEFTPAEPNSKLIAEDQLQRAGGSASATASLAASDTWGAGFAAIRSASGAALPLTVSISPSTASVPTGYGTQSFTASLVNDFQHQGVTWSLSGAGCSGSTCGSLTNATTTSVTYNAPALVPNPATVTLTATAVADGTKTGTATITVTQGVVHVSVSPKRAAVTMSASQTVQFTATVTNDPQNLGVTWQVDGNNGGTAASGTISNTGLYTPGTQPGVHTVTATSVANASISASSTVAVTDLKGVYTYHNDTARTGQNLQEYALTTANVNSTTFGPLFSCPVDGFLYPDPLYVANLTIGGQTRNVLFVATTHDSVYAFDADSPACIQLWTISFLSPGVTTVAPADVNDSSNDMFPEIGITSTPVIDPSTNTIYVEAKTKDTVSSGCSTSAPCYFHHLHALDLITGTEKFNGPVLISASGFNSRIHHQRPALLLANGTVYIAFGSHGDKNSYQGWLMGYDAANLQTQKFVTPLTIFAGNRGGVWQGGAGPAADANGNVYISTGNGTFNADTGGNNYGDSAVKLSPTGAILDYFTPFNQSTFSANDIDLGSAGVMILPDSVGSTAHPHLALVTGKVAILYLVDVGTPVPPQTTTMGRFNSTSNNDVQEVIPVPPPNTTLLDGGNFGSLAYWNGNIYSTGVSFPLSQFQIANGVISNPQLKSGNNFPLRGAIPAVSASGATNGIVWILDLSAWPSNGPAILDAYDAASVSTLLYSSPASGSGAAPPAVKFTVPTVANGRVYVPGQYMFTVFGLSPNK